MSSAKSSNPFHGWNYFDQLGESSFMPNYYQQEMEEPMTFRSLSPKLYNQTTDYFETDDELFDDSDALYEATLLNSNFLELKPPSVTTSNNTSSVDRLCQLLNHLNPNYSPLAQILSETPSVRSQFSSSSQPLTQPMTSSPAPTVPMVTFSMSDPRDFKGKGKGKF